MGKNISNSLVSSGSCTSIMCFKMFWVRESVVRITFFGFDFVDLFFFLVIFLWFLNLSVDLLIYLSIDNKW